MPKRDEYPAMQSNGPLPTSFTRTCNYCRSGFIMACTCYNLVLLRLAIAAGLILLWFAIAAGLILQHHVKQIDWLTNSADWPALENQSRGQVNSLYLLQVWFYNGRKETEVSCQTLYSPIELLLPFHDFLVYRILADATVKEMEAQWPLDHPMH